MSSGRWVEDDARWFELRMHYCDLCGRVIPKHLWQVEIDTATRTFCDTACELLYREYVLGIAREMTESSGGRSTRAVRPYAETVASRDLASEHSEA